ncbi:hypothetical protein LB506_012835 [Fusarium annulatum]|nr:hypothetical protein LB506_012835 [Fusarium annulatum]
MESSLSRLSPYLNSPTTESSNASLDQTRQKQSAPDPRSHWTGGEDKQQSQVFNDRWEFRSKTLKSWNMCLLTIDTALSSSHHLFYLSLDG